MNSVHVRGACPSLPRPMETGDGLLARLAVNAAIPLDAFISLCEAARAHGNGTMEVSARGSLQVRGLSPLSVPQFADALAALDIEISGGVPVLADPLPNDPAVLIDTQTFAAQLRQTIAEAGLKLAPKVSVVVDGGGCIGLDALAADIRLRSIATGEGPRFQLALAGDAMSATPVALIAIDDAVDDVLALLKDIAMLGPEARAGDLEQSRAGRRSPRATPRQSPRAHPIGCHPLKGGIALGVGLAFGHAEGGSLIEIAQIAKANGAGWARPAPGRAVLFGPLGAGEASATQQAAQRLGFVTEASDPRRRIAACPGAPACAHGLIAARVLAAEIAHHVSLPGDDIALHISGCAKGCAHPRAAPLTIVGTEQGCGVVRDGSARDAPTEYGDPADLVATLERIARREAVHA